MGGANYSPVSKAGADDAIDPALAGANQLYKKLTATSKNPVPLNLKALGAGTIAGIAAESTTQNALDAFRGGKPSDNPYVANLEKLGSRIIGGATTGAVYGKSPASATVGAIGGAAIDIGDNVIESSKLTPEIVQLIKDKQETNRIEKELLKKYTTRSKLIPIREVIRQRKTK